VPPLLIVCGPPGAGKSLLVGVLSRELELPVISKDSVKEAIMDHAGGGPEIGAAAFAVQFAIARELLRSDVGLILEGAFFRTQTELADLARAARPAIIELSCEIAELERRYVARIDARHPGHRGLEALPDLRERVATGQYTPALDCPRLGVDTSDGLDPSEDQIVEWARRATAAPGR